MITKEYKFEHSLPPFKHQELEFIRSRDRKYYALWWEMGTGKSKVIVDTAAWLFTRGEIDGVILVSDKGAYRTWETEVAKHLHPDIPHRMAVWSSYMNRAQQREVDEMMTPQDNLLDFLCVNVEAFSSNRAITDVRRFISTHYCMFVVDESTSIKNPKAGRTRAVIQLGRLCDYRRCLTGTPITQCPLDLYSQCEFLYQSLLGFRTFTEFRATYAQMITMSLGTRSFQKIVGYRRLDELTNSIQPFSSRILKSECLDLPEKLYEIRHVELSPEQQAAYDSLRQTALIEFEQGLLTSTSALTTINKLQQICCGHVALDNRTRVDIPSLRVPALQEVLDIIGMRKVIIWCAFQRDVELIMGVLENRARHYYGKTSDSERMRAIDDFVRGDAQYFVGTAATGGKSLTLTVAHHVVYYSNSYSLEDRLQSEDRAHRIGQVQNVTYVDLVSPGTIDERVLKILRDKRELSHEVLDKFRELLQ